MDAKKQVLGRHRSRKHNLQHVYAPTFVIFHEKKRPRMAFFRQRLSSLAPDKHSKTPPPILRVLDAKKQVVRAHRRRKTQFAACVCTKTSHFSSKIGQKWPFSGQKFKVFGPRQAVEDPSPPILTVLDANKQDVGRHRAGEHNLQHPYVPKSAVFHEKSQKK